MRWYFYTLACLILFVGVAHAQFMTGSNTYTENFESQNAPGVPTGNWYQVVDNNVGSFITASTTATGSTKALLYLPNAGAGLDGGIYTKKRDYNFDLCTASQHLEFDVFLPTDASNGYNTVIRFGQHGGTGIIPGGQLVALTFATVSSVTYSAKLEIGSSSNTFTTTLSQNALHHVSIGMLQNCGASTGEKATVTIDSLTPVILSDAAVYRVMLDAMSISCSVCHANSFYFDNFVWSGVPTIVHSDNFEDFESYAVGEIPSKPYYTLTTNLGTGHTFGGVRTCLPESTTSVYAQSKCMDDTGGGTSTDSYLIFNTNADLCPKFGLGPRFTFFHMDAGSGADNYIGIADASTFGAAANYIRLHRPSSAGPAALEWKSPGGTGTTSTPQSGYNVHSNTISFTCPGTTFKMALDAIGDGTTTISSVTFSQPMHYLLTDSGANGGAIVLDNLDFGPNAQSSTASAAQTVAFPSGYTLVGYDADYNQGAVVGRLVHAGDNVQKIYSWDPITLVNRRQTPVANACTTGAPLDGVMAMWQQPPGASYVGWADCLNNAADVSALSIGDGGLNQPPDFTGTLCVEDGDANNFCSYNLGSADTPSGCPSNGELSGRLQQLGLIIPIPISFRGGTTEDRDRVRIGFAYGTTQGRVGVWVNTQTHPGSDFTADYSCYVESDFSGNSGPADDICSWHNQIDGNDYLTAVSSGALSRTWQLTFEDVSQATDIGGTTVRATVPHMTQTSQLSSAVGVGCNNFSNTTLLQLTNGHINRYKTVGTPGVGTPDWVFDITDASGSRGVTMSRNGLWGAYKSSDGVHWKVFDASTGAIKGLGTLPSGTYRGMRMSGNGHDLYIFTTTSVTRYHVGDVLGTNTEPDSCGPEVVCVIYNTDTTPANPVEGGGGGGGGTSGNPFDSDSIVGGIITPLLGPLGSMGNLVLGLIVIGACVAAVYVVRRKRDGQ